MNQEDKAMTMRVDAVTSNPGIFSMKVELTDCSAS